MKREIIEKYQAILKKDPNSQVFAALAESYREMGMLVQAEKTAREGTERHPSYVSGFVILGRILVTQERWREAEFVLQKAATLGPENILAHQLLGQVYLQTKRPKEALKAYKLVLFLNPQSDMAKKAVEKLESLTADEFEEDIFQMKKLPNEGLGEMSAAISPVSRPSPGAITHGLGSSRERSLALVDAFIVRNEMTQARSYLQKLALEFPNDEKINERWDMIAAEEESIEEAASIEPDLTREHFIRDRKIQRLEFVLRRIKTLQYSPKN
jgi:tetratricopeptide (TPR) repeat protein